MSQPFLAMRVCEGEIMKPHIGFAFLTSSIVLSAVVGGSSCSKTPQPDNTKFNERDRTMTSVTPLSQGNNRADLDTTQSIRRAIMQVEGLSVDAKNIKIITADGVVTLRGPVKSDAERQAIETAAKAAAGSNRVENQIEIEGAR